MNIEHQEHRTLHSYRVGFLMSLALTLIAFGLSYAHSQNGFSTPTMLLVAFVFLAILQLIVQLVFFLHLGKGSTSSWNSVMFGFALFIIVVVVGGTLWIMHNLKHTSMDTFGGGVISADHETD